MRMILWKHTASELQRLFLHLKRLLVSSKVRVRGGEIIHGRACTSHKISRVQRNALTTIHRIALTYIRMILWKHTASELQRLFPHLKRLLVSSKGRVRVGEITHGHACTSHKISRVQRNALTTIHLSLIHI